VHRRFVSCFAEAAADELHALPKSTDPMIFIIFDHRKFLQTREVFHAYGTSLAFSNLAVKANISLHSSIRGL
jgi:hypothetical protein